MVIVLHCFDKVDKETTILLFTQENIIRDLSQDVTLILYMLDVFGASNAIFLNNFECKKFTRSLMLDKSHFTKTSSA